MTTNDIQHEDDEARLRSFLLSPGSYPAELRGGRGTIEHIETHISHVFLTGTHALKLKKRVRFDFLDFSTLERRRQACHDEVRLNSAYSDRLYLGVREIRERDGVLSFGGEGRVVDTVVVMREFPASCLFSKLLDQGKLDEPLLAEAARRIAAFHRSSPAEPAFGGAAELRRELDEVFGVFHGRSDFSELVKTIEKEASLRLDELAPLLEARRAAHVRRIHGDLHLRNICFFENRVQLFDGIEFSDALSHGDVWCDLAFLLMDLLFHGRRADAALVRNIYAEETDDFGGLPLLPLFISYRAAVRGKVSVLGDEASRGDAHAYLAFAAAALGKNTEPPKVIAVGGLSGSGKSTVAKALSLAIDAVQIRADAVRKHLLGVRLDGKLPSAGYTAEADRRTYAGMLERAKEALRGGYSVVLDATFRRREMQEEVRRFAEAENVMFAGFRCEVPESVARERISKRRGDVSDADIEVFEKQRKAAAEPSDWLPVDTSGPVDSSVGAIQRAFAKAGCEYNP